jgi:glycolate oxidase
MYNPLTTAVVEQLSRIVGAGNVVFDADKLQAYSHDETPDRRYAHMPDVAVRVGSAEEIAAIMKLANRENIPVTPRGAGSGLSGGAVPLYGGIVLLTDRLNKVLEIDRENMFVVVQPGVVTNEINELLKPYGLFYAGYPMSLETCYIGGNVAENAGGGKAVKYGVTGRYVTGVEVVTPQGEIVSLGGKLVKDVTGYNIIQLLVGSEGTLGIFTKIILKLIPLPKATVDLLCLFKTAEEAISAVPKIMTGGGIIPTAIEFMDRTSVKAACDYLNESIPYEQCGAMLLITVDGPGIEQVEREYEVIGEMCLEAGAMEVYVADNHTTSERIWKVRRNIGEAFNLLSRRQSNEDIVVPIAAIPKVVTALGEIARKYGVQAPCFGHAGDGNLHARLVSDPAWSDEQWRELAPKMLTELYTFTASLGGMISGEHGIGHRKKPFLGLSLQPAAIELMKSIKRAWDPNNILNPGKIFDV